MDAGSSLVGLAALLLVLAPLGALQAVQPPDDPTHDTDTSSNDDPDPDSPETSEVIVTTTGPPEPVAERAQSMGTDVGWTYDLIDAFSAHLTPAAQADLAEDP